MTLNKNILNSNFIFNVKTLKCGFCTNKINECEFDEDSKCFLCYRCKYTKNNYPKNLKNITIDQLKILINNNPKEKNYFSQNIPFSLINLQKFKFNRNVL